MSLRKKIKLNSLLGQTDLMTQIESPVYGEAGVKIFYRTLDLLWRPAGKLVRFVMVSHPTRGSIILMSTDLKHDPVEIIRLYGLRFKIELGFKQAVHSLGTYAYHFWMKGMKRIRRCSGNQYLHRESDEYRDAVRRKLQAYHAHVQTGLIAQGLLQFLSLNFTNVVWATFGSWIRTIRPGVLPTEPVVASALRSALPDFLRDDSREAILAKFIRSRIDLERSEGLSLTG